MSDIKIEKNVPLPVSSVVPPLPLNLMKVGDSFVVPIKTEIDQNTVRQRVWRYKNSNPPAQFSVRIWDDGKSIRVFRKEDAK